MHEARKGSMGMKKYFLGVGQSCRFAHSSFERVISSNARDFPQVNASGMFGRRGSDRPA
jgi:hypothetical protein